MGSSACGAENGGIDETVGGLVWVRRRNGSWWPGQIISVDELPKSSLLAAKPGTPVKLLGRDDASIDWYNLNKSKRVKEFRCGDFDKCIEKVKDAVSTIKKSVKYARREDAIICALEIENSYELMDKESSREYNSAKKPNGNVSMNSLVVDENINAEDELSVPLKPLSVKGKRRKTPNDSEDDGIGVKRMRVIKDLVLEVASEIEDEVDEESSHVNQEITGKGNLITVESPANSDKSNTSSLKRKQSAVANSNGHESKRRKDRRRTLTRVLEESVMVSVPVICNELSGTVESQPMDVSERAAAVESIDSEGISSDSTNNCVNGTANQCGNAVISNCLNVACDLLCDDHKLKEKSGADCLPLLDSRALDELYDVHLSMDGDSAGYTPTIPTSLSGEIQIDGTKLCPPTEQVEDVPIMNGEVPAFNSTSQAAAFDGINYDLLKTSSAWQSKRKRNSRRTSNHKKQDLKNIEDVLNNGNSYQGSGLEQNLGGFSEFSNLKVDYKQKELTIDPEDGFPNWGKHFSHRDKIEGVQDEASGPTRSLPYRHSRLVVPSKYEEADFPTRNTRLEQGAEPCLHDVHVSVEVKASNHSHHVPMVSFMSKFNGKAIVGHPLTVDITDNGYSDVLLNHFTGNSKHRSSKGRGTRKQSKPRSGSRKVLLQISGPLSKKTKRLSAITGSRKSREHDKNSVVEKPMSSAIACVPLNVVFSRLNEAVNGSKQHHFRTLCNQ